MWKDVTEYNPWQKRNFYISWDKLLSIKIAARVVYLMFKKMLPTESGSHRSSNWVNFEQNFWRREVNWWISREQTLIMFLLTYTILKFLFQKNEVTFSKRFLFELHQKYVICTHKRRLQHRCFLLNFVDIVPFFQKMRPSIVCKSNIFNSCIVSQSYLFKSFASLER